MAVVSLKSAHNGCFNRHRVDLQYDSRTIKASSSYIVHSSKLHVSNAWRSRNANECVDC